MPNSPEHELMIELQDLIIGTETVADFLSGLSIVAAATIGRSLGTPVECGVTLKRQRGTTTVGGSSARAILLDKIEQRIGQGPCIEALRIKAPVLLNDVRTDPRWPAYQEQLIAEDCLGVLGVPLELNEDSAAALNFFAKSPGVFTEAIVREAAGFADIAGGAVRLAVKVGTAQDAAQDLQAAMRSRTAIDLACGIIMAQNGCTQAEAMDILVKVSSNRNQKLRDITEEMIVKISGVKPTTHFDGHQARP
jgi:GAF domain-containing protein